MQEFRYEDYSKPNFIDQLIEQKLDCGYCKLYFNDGTSIKLPVRMAILNILFWEVIMLHGIKPSIHEFVKIKSITGSSVSKIHTILYEKLLDTFPETDHMIFVKNIFDNICRLYNYIQVHLGQYMPSIDGLSLAYLMNNPELKALADTYLDPKQGTKVAEQRFKQISSDCIKLLNNPNLPHNVLYPYIQADVLKTNQVPQMLLAYGTRSDVDDTMRKHVINESSMSGLKSPEDFATESLSAKKAIYFSKDVIKKSSYSGRKMRLGCATQSHIYRGSCGSPGTIPFLIKPKLKFNFVDKMILDEGKRIILTHENIDSYVDKPIQMISPFMCRHTDGFCEACAGYGKDRLIKYMPHNIHIGFLASTKVSSKVNQKILSTKHLISTTSKIYNLPDIARKYFFKDKDSLYWTPEWGKNLKGYEMRIPSDALSPIVDLCLDTLPIAESFSKVAYWELLYEGEVVDIVKLENDSFVPYLSNAALEYMRKNYNKLVIEDDYVVVPLDGFDVKQEFFKYVIMNDDMITYTKRVSGFLSSSLINYNSVSNCLNDFADIVMEKTPINIFFLEVVLRSFCIQSPEEIRIPIIEDPNKVSFGNLDMVISESSITQKLAFERLQEYLNSPRTPITARPAGLFAPYFGLI